MFSSGGFHKPHAWFINTKRFHGEVTVCSPIRVDNHRCMSLNPSNDAETDAVLRV